VSHLPIPPALLFACAVCVFAPMAGADDLGAEVVSAELGRRYDEALFRKAAAHDSATVRVAVARAAGRLKRTEAVAWLLPLARDPEGRVRRAALFALGQIGGTEFVIPLRESLGRLGSNDLAVALEALGKSRDPRAVSATTEWLTHRAPAVRQAAALALFRLGDTSAIPELVAALLIEAEPESRWRQVYAISRLLRARAGKAKGPVAGDAAWIEALRASTAKDRPFFERSFATRALGALQGQADFLHALTGDSDPRIVVSAVRALGGDPKGGHAEKLGALLTHKDDLVREAAVGALERVEKPAPDVWTANWTGALPRLTGELRLRALLALAATGDIRAPAGQFDNVADGKELAEAYTWMLVPHAGKDAPRPNAADLKSIRAMREAATTCGNEKVPLPWAIEVLRTLIAVDDFTVQTMAIGTLAERGAKAEAPRIVAAAIAARGPAWADVRTEAANALAQLEVYDPWLNQAAMESDRFVREAARTALEKLKRPLPPKRSTTGFQLDGKDTRAVLAAAQELVGARVRLKTSRGVITMMLLPDEAPVHCVNLARLVSRGFYDNRRWHRVVADFVIQGGCPRGDGWGGPGYTIPDEIGTRPYVRGTVGMPKSGDDTGGCQIFITHLPTPHLDGRYTVFAQVIEGLDVIDRIRVGDKILKATLEVREKR